MVICQRQKELGLAPDWARGLAGPESWKQRPAAWKGSISTNAATKFWSVRMVNFIASPVTRARLHLDSTIDTDTDTEQSLPREPVPSSFHRHRRRFTACCPHDADSNTDHVQNTFSSSRPQSHSFPSSQFTSNQQPAA